MFVTLLKKCLLILKSYSDALECFISLLKGFWNILEYILGSTFFIRWGEIQGRKGKFKSKVAWGNTSRTIVRTGGSHALKPLLNATGELRGLLSIWEACSWSQGVFNLVRRQVPCNLLLEGEKYLLRYNREDFTFLSLKSGFSFIWHDRSHTNPNQCTNAWASWPCQEEIGQGRSKVNQKVCVEGEPAWNLLSGQGMVPHRATHTNDFTGVLQPGRLNRGEGAWGRASTKFSKVFIPSVSLSMKLVFFFF